MKAPKLKIYYDGLCHLCSMEIVHYRKQPGSESLEFIDITSKGFDANREGVDSQRVNKEMHVRRQDGSLAIGVDAFVAIWEVLPRYRWAARMARLGIVNLAMRAGYTVFAEIRPYLPKRAESCDLSKLS
jgi:predicted DCC family thiol-disulfide oxidoreductase YuxK